MGTDAGGTLQGAPFGCPRARPRAVPEVACWSRMTLVLATDNKDQMFPCTPVCDFKLGVGLDSGAAPILAPGGPGKTMVMLIHLLIHRRSPLTLGVASTRVGGGGCFAI